MNKQRQLAVDILYHSFHDSSYTNLMMRKKLNELPKQQRPFVSNLIYGVLREYDLLLYNIRQHYTKDPNQYLILVLCTAAYEKFFINEKDYIVNNEYVSFGKNRYEKSFLNAVLRSMDFIHMPEDLWIKESLPEFLFRLLKAQYTDEQFQKIIKNFKNPAQTVYRLNPKKCKHLDLDNIHYLDKYSFTCDDNLLGSNYFLNGDLYIQDFNSSSLISHLDLKECSIFLDACSAPGSKFFNALETIKEKNAYANDVHPHRVELIKKKALRLGYHDYHISCHDARDLDSIYSAKFDRILLDVPCSGLGVIGRRPDIKYHITPTSLDEISILQREILDSVSKLLVSGGILLYTTCTLNKKENHTQIVQFLNRDPSFVLEEEDTLINDLGDCFFYAKLKKV